MFKRSLWSHNGMPANAALDRSACTKNIRILHVDYQFSTRFLEISETLMAPSRVVNTLRCINSCHRHRDLTKRFASPDFFLQCSLMAPFRVVNALRCMNSYHRHRDSTNRFASPDFFAMFSISGLRRFFQKAKNKTQKTC